MNTSEAMQEYLAEAYRLAYYQSDSHFISTSALAEVLHVSPPAVTRMVQRLKEAGYLEHEPYRGIALTPAGEREALMSIRRHRLVERFLVDVMDFGWHEVHDEADDLGAVVSQIVVERMALLAGSPRRCPHGEPIPTEDGVMPQVVDYPLNDISLNQEMVISRVTTHDAGKLDYLGTLGLKPGTGFTLIERAPFNGPLQLAVNGSIQVIGYELAGALRVCTLDEYNLV
ncbi:MAG: metal-dependent transcriptional regulator [Anaerolineaceae bacterium]|nr:metal-dependent transcriptional regulator [Anaerolineaceae bacterium]